MKYIPADKLIAEIKKQQSRLTVLSYTEQVDIRRDCALQNGVYDYILSIITSLQQEEPENEEKIMNFFDALGDCGFSQHDILLLKNIWKEAGCTPPKFQVAGVSKMEHLELKKEIRECWQNWLSPSNQNSVDGVLPKEEFAFYARHFAEWGAIHLNARKK